MIDGILIPYHREKALKFPKISTFQKVTISEVSYINEVDSLSSSN